MLPKELHHRYISILFISGLLIWIQGSFLVWDYGLIGKGEIDWTLSTWRGWVDGTLWIMLLIVAFLFYKQIYRITTFVIIILFSLQLMYFIFSIVQTPEIWKEKDESSLIAICKRHPSTITRELRRNTGGRGYRAKQAHQKALCRRYTAKKATKFTYKTIRLVVE